MARRRLRDTLDVSRALDATITTLRQVVRNTKHGSQTCQHAFRALVAAKTARTMLKVEGVRAMDPLAPLTSFAPQSKRDT